MENIIKIKEHSSFRGTYSGSGDLELYGSFEGVLKINTLYVKKTGLFVGKLAAQKIIIEGEVSADIEAETLHLKPTGLVDGDLIYHNSIIESGGLLNSKRVHNMSNDKDIMKFKSNN